LLPFSGSKSKPSKKRTRSELHGVTNPEERTLLSPRFLLHCFAHFHLTTLFATYSYLAVCLTRDIVLVNRVYL
jgi:hypothetical protein